VKELEESLAKAEDVKTFIQQRKQYLSQQLSALPFTKELKKVNKQAYYYSAQVAEYKEVLKDSKKRERKAVVLLSKTKLFPDIMKKNSMLASLFRMPGNDDPANAMALSGLQTRASVNSLVQARLGSGGTNAQAAMQQNMQAAQAQLATLKSQISRYSGGSYGNSAEVAMPDFKPNNQKTKSFLKRLELGTNLQTQKDTRYFPATSDLGLSVGYRLNDKSVVGVGAAYKLGLGSG
jgi:hypothetical protein